MLGFDAQVRKDHSAIRQLLAHLKNKWRGLSCHRLFILRHLLLLCLMLTFSFQPRFAIHYYVPMKKVCTQCTEEILEEVQRNLVSKRKITEQQARRLMDTIRKQFPEAFVTNYKYLINSMANNPKDRHVLAAAVACGAKVIVTNNLRDFPQSTLASFEIEIQHPDDFLVQLFYLYPEFMVEIIEKQAKDLQRPPKTTLELLNTLNRHVPNFVSLVRASIL